MATKTSKETTQYYQGFYRPKNPHKYKGNPANIIFRSSWELKVMRWLDLHPQIIEWGSEELVIPYRSPIDNRIHRYFPDFVAKKRNKDGTMETFVIEVKPYNQTQQPKPQKRRTRKYVNEVYRWGINEAKWNAARAYCEQRNWQFVTMTEKDLGIG